MKVVGKEKVAAFPQPLTRAMRQRNIYKELPKSLHLPYPQQVSGFNLTLTYLF